jgi:hypothetical protein
MAAMLLSLMAENQEVQRRVVCSGMTFIPRFVKICHLLQMREQPLEIMTS